MAANCTGRLEAAAAGERLAPEDTLRLAREADFHDLLAAARAVRFRRRPERVVTYIVNANVNSTNVCVTRCGFCAFYRPPGHPEAYVLGADEVVRRARAAEAAGATQLLLQGGHHPRLGLEYYEDLFRAVRERTSVHLHGLSAPEVLHLSRVSRRPVEEVLARLVAAGLQTLPGGGAEVLSDEVRRAISPLKCSAGEWLDVHETAHRMGLSSSATLMFGTAVDDWSHRIEHLERLRRLQDRTGGFTAFIAWAYQPAEGLVEPGRRGAATYVRLVALARLHLDNFGTIQASPLTQAPGVLQLALDAGADDYGNVLLEEHVVHAAGVERRATEETARREIVEAGYVPARRDTFYRVEARA